MDNSIHIPSAGQDARDVTNHEETELQSPGGRPLAHIPRLQSVLESIASQPDGELPEQHAVAPFTQSSVEEAPPPYEAIENLSDSQSVDNRPLNVTDALSYLDAVKKQFEDRPDVYNDFLDIMKDFKSQKIDTPGVIERVSQLFHGHNDLIQGFNTFLPPGYRIECSQDAMDNNMITVTTPSGTTTQTTEVGRGGRQITTTSASTLPQPIVGANLPSISRPETPLAVSSSPMPYATSSAATWLGGLGNKGGVPERQGQGPAGAEEFHHAIQYVNKIKTRFEDDPDTYKQFLDILHAYRKEQNHDDSQVYAQVYAQVQVLFKDAPDLLAEFKDFLPATGGGSFSGGRPSSPAINDVVMQDNERRPTKAESSAAKRKKRPVEKDQAAPQIASAPAKLTGSSRSKKSKHSHVKADNASASPFHSQSRPESPSLNLPQSHGHNQSHNQPVAHEHPQAGPSVPQVGLSAGQSSAIAGPQDEFAFFDRAKKVLEASQAYDEFLKLLNLFSKEIIDAQTLIQRAETFLDGELYTQFKDLMGWDDKREGDNEGPPGSIRNWAADWSAKSAPEKEERYGKSYRRLPLAETKLACSGRDELCWTVLNDVWVSHPTWASEESGFVSHKKNSYEEALHKSEEERHEFQFYIDIITRTIALFQPLYDRIQEMNAEEKNAYRLPPDFGGSSKSIYHRAIKKVYGRDAHGMEVLQALQECPAVAIPVILPRLKQKNEEWRRAQREWNRVWREVDARNFYKSLDHQGISFKANDKKYITTKSFVGEIDGAKAEIAERVARLRAKARSKKLPTPVSEEGSKSTGNVSSSEVSMQDIYDAEFAPHLEFSFSDLSVLQDALKLVFSFLDRSTIQYSSHERRTVERMLRSFIPLLFMLNVAEFDSAFGPPLESDGTDNEDFSHDDAAAGGGASADETDEPHHSTRKSGGTSGRRSAGGSSVSGSHGHGGVHPSDLRKKLLKTAQEKASKAAKSGSASASRAASPAGSDDEHSKRSHARGASPSPTPKKKKSGRTKEKEDIQRVEWEEWVELMPVAYDTGSKASGAMDGMEVDSQEDFVERLAKHGVIDAKPFFMNTTFYALLRLLQLLYSRLLLCKGIGQRLVNQNRKSSVFTVNPVAEELGLVDAHGPGAVLALAASVPTHPPSGVGEVRMASGDQSDAENRMEDRPESHFYGYLLDACEKLFEGEFDQTTFEENMRFLFGTKAYNVFTLDKVIAALIKQVQTVVVDSKCQELLALLSKARTKPGTLTMRDLIAYRREAEQYLGQDDHLYRVDWAQGPVIGRVMKMWLLGSTDPSADINSLSHLQGSETGDAHRLIRIPKGTAVARWRAYMESYVLSSPTELVDEQLKGRLHRTFLTRTREESDEEAPAVTRPERCVISRGLEVGVQPGTYKLLYRNGSEESTWRWRTREEEAISCGRATTQREERIRKMANIELGL